VAGQSQLRLAELVACLTLATDLATGQPLEHGLRRTLLAMWLGAASGLDEAELAESYYVALLGSVGCVLDSAAIASFVTAQVLAVADAYQSKLEPRPHRPARTPEAAAESTRGQVIAGKLDGDVVKAVLEAAGHPEPPTATTPPCGLTKREVEVLRLLVRGMSNREIAESLFLSPKTVGRHLESIYAKVDVSTRVGATLFAIEHGLAANLSGGHCCVDRAGWVS
jgi:DNA-binding CsgD family transcriptional regulator